MAKDRIGFIGLGDMGFPMARRLLRHGFTVVSCANRRREPIDALKKDGLIEADGPGAVGAQVDILMTIVVGDRQTDAVLRGPTGALSSMKPGSIVILMSTLSPTYCQDIAREAWSKGIEVLDCPVSGGNIGAEKGTLALIVGGKPEPLDRARSALTTLGVVHHCGEIGMGQVAKLANNSIAYVAAAAVQEAREMARSYGMDPEKLLEIVGKSTGRCFAAENWDFIRNNWSHLSVLGRQDIRLCLDAAKAKMVNMRMAQKCLEGNWDQDAN